MCITDDALLYIKLSTMAFELLFAFVVYLFAKNIFDRKIKTSILIAILSLFIPTVIVNGSIASQCDIIFTTMLCLMLYFILKEKYKLSLLFFGLAFAIKLQAIFIAPIVLYLLIHKKVRIRDIFIIPVPYVVFALPAVVAGKNIIDILKTYVSQTEIYPRWTLNAPNIYQFGDLNMEIINLIATIAMVLFTAVVVLFTIIQFRKVYSKNIVIVLTLFFASIIPYLLPKMHERYFFIADILSFLYVIGFGIKKYHIHLYIVFASFFSYSNFLNNFYKTTFNNNFLNMFSLRTLAISNLIAIFLIIIDLILEYKNEKEAALK